MSTIITLTDGTKVAYRQAASDLAEAGKAIAADLQVGHAATLRAAYRLHNVKASRLYVAALTVAEIKASAKDARVTAWSTFCDKYDISETDRSRLVARADTILRMVAKGANKGAIESLAADTLKHLRKLAYASKSPDFRVPVQCVSDLTEAGTKVTASAVKDWGGRQGYNTPTDRPITLAKLVATVAKMIASDRPIDHGSITLAEVDTMLADLATVRENLASKLETEAAEAAEAAALADMAEADEDEDEDDLTDAA